MLNNLRIRWSFVVKKKVKFIFTDWDGNQTTILIPGCKKKAPVISEKTLGHKNINPEKK